MQETLPIDVGGPEGSPEYLGPYRIAGELGHGGSGVVYRGIGPDGRQCAIKTVARISVWSLASLRVEINALRRLRHPGIVRVFDDGVDAGRPWFAMDHIHGVTLAEHAAALRPAPGSHGRPCWQPAALDAVLRLVLQIFEALAVVHEAGVVHRDLKPENVLVQPDGQPIIVDFGLAVARPPTSTRVPAEPVRIAGTTAYMAPEQLTGALVDARTDLYAMGCVLFELLTGSPPDGPGGVRPSAYVDGVPESIGLLVDSLLSSRPRHRIGCAEDAIECIVRELGEQVAAPPAQRLRQWLYRPQLVGRGDVLERAGASLRRLSEGRGAFLVLVGESGIGKSHIASEITRKAGSDALVIVAGSDAVLNAPSPLACWSRLFEVLADFRLARPTSSVAGAVARHRATLASLSAAFGSDQSALALREDRPTPGEVFAALRDLLGALAENGPVVLLLEDIQWADEVTVEVLQLLKGSSLMDKPVLFLATCRDDERSPGLAVLMASPGTERIAVGPLCERELRELVADMLGVPEPPEVVVDWIVRRAEGNPFLAAEYLRLVIADVPMTREVSLPIVRVRPPTLELLASLPTPSSVHELAGRRLSLVDAAARRLAELMAIMGGTIDGAVLEHCIEDALLRDALTDLARHQLTVQTSDGGMTLLHDRLRVAVLQSSSPEHQRELHRDAARLLSSMKVVSAAAVAHHFAAAGMLSEALPYMEQAGDSALARAAYETAVSHFDDARAAAEQLSLQGELFSAHRRVRWAHGAARGNFGRGDLLAAEQRVRDALRLCGHELPRNGSAWTGLVLRQGLATALGRIAEPPALDGALLVELSSAASLLPHRYFYEEDLPAVMGTSLLAVSLAKRANAPTAVGPASHLGMTAGFFRLHAMAQRFFDQARQVGVSSRQWRDTTQALLLESFYHSGFGRWAKAEQAVLQAAAICANATDPWMIENVETTRAHVEFFTGRFADAKARSERLAASARDRQNDQHEVWGLYLQARSDLASGRFADARALLEAALRRLRERPELISQLACTGMLAEACLGERDLGPAEEQAFSVLQLIKARTPSAYPTIVGYTGAARVFRYLAENAPSPERRRGTRSISAALWRFASLFPMARPAAYLHAGHLLRIAGLPRAANRMFLRGARQAEAFAMPYDRGQLLCGAARTARGDGEQTLAREWRACLRDIDANTDESALA